MEINENLKALRKGAGLTQSDFAEKTGVHFQTVSKWERGASVPDVGMLGIISEVLGVTLEKLLGQEECENPIKGTFNGEALATAISTHRKKVGLSQVELGEKVGSSSDGVSKWERGVTLPDIQTLIYLAQIFGVSVSYLYYGITEEEQTELPVFYNKGSVKRWKITTVALAICLIASILALVFLTPSNKTYTVKIEGYGEYSVGSNDWFTPPTPEKSGYEFIGFVNENGEEVKTPFTAESDLTVYPTFAPVEYSVDYWLNGGNFQTDPQTYFTVESGEIILAIPQKTGETFEGWYLSADYSGEAVQSVVCNASDITLYAKWSNAVFGVRYELNGGVMGENPHTIDKTQVITLTNPSKSGYIFLGWWTSPNGGEQITQIGGENARNLTLFALWQKTDAFYSLTYNLNGGTFEDDKNQENTVQLASGSKIKLPTAQKTGHDFLGWNTLSDGTGEYLTWLTCEQDQEVYAIFTPKQFVVRYEYQGVYLTQANESFITYGEEVCLNEVIYEGHDFLGWFTSPTGGEKIEKITPENLLYITVLYAQYAPKKFNVTLRGSGGSFAFNGGVYESLQITYEYGTEITLPLCSKQNYTFIGWVDEFGKPHEKIDTNNYFSSEFIAKFYFTEGCLIDYQLDGGEIVGDYPTRIKQGKTEELPVAKKQGYKFLGWNELSDGTGEFYTHTPTTDKEVITIYAIWQDVFIMGDSDSFSYVKTATQVTITKYTRNEYADDISLVIPSYIDGLPVTKIDSFTFQEYNYLADCLEEYYLSFASLTLPETLREIAPNAIVLTEVFSPLIIPKNVSYIGENGIMGRFTSVMFEEGSALTVLEEGAFENLKIIDVFELPEGVEEIRSSSLPLGAIGYIFPSTLKTIHNHAFSRYGGSGDLTLYLPAGVTSVGEYALGSAKVYSDVPQEVLNTFPQNWCGEFLGETNEYTLTLKDGEKVLSQEKGVAFHLPEPKKAGYNFVGWQTEDKTPVCEAYINSEFKNVTLYAVYSVAGANDGTSPDNPIVIDGSKDFYEFSYYTGRELYIIFDNTKTAPFAMEIHIINNTEVRAVYAFYAKRTINECGYEGNFYTNERVYYHEDSMIFEYGVCLIYLKNAQGRLSYYTFTFTIEK